jgi:hypothetical protein
MYMSEMTSILKSLASERFDLWEQLIKNNASIIMFVSFTILMCFAVCYVAYEMLIFSVMRFFSRRFLPDFEKKYGDNQYVNLFRENFFLAQFAFLFLPSFSSLHLPYMLLCSLILKPRTYFKTVSGVALVALSIIQTMLIIACIFAKFFN